MSSVANRLDQVFRTGSGAVMRNVQYLDTESALAVVAECRDEIVSAPSRTIVEGLLACLLALRGCQGSSRYDAARRAKDTCDTHTAELVELLGAFGESERLRLSSAELTNRISSVMESY